MSGDDRDLVGKGEEGIADGLDELLRIAAGKIGTSYGAGEEGISGEQESLLGKVKADAAFSVTGSVENRAGESCDRDELAIFEFGVGRSDFGRGNAEPSSLDVHHLYQRQVVLVVEDRSSGEFFEVLGSGDVIDVSVGDDDLLYGELMLGKGADDAGDVVAGIDHDGFAGDFVAEDGAVALERADDEDFVDHGLKTKGLTRIFIDDADLKTGTYAGA